MTNRIYAIIVQSYSPAPVLTGFVLLTPVASTTTRSFDVWLFGNLQQPTSKLGLGEGLFTVAVVFSYNTEERFFWDGTSIAGFRVKKSEGLNEI